MRYYLTLLLSVSLLTTHAQRTASPRAPSAAGIKNDGFDRTTGELTDRAKNQAAQYSKVNARASDLPLTLNKSNARALNRIMSEAPRSIVTTGRGGGVYLLDETDTTTPDNTGTVLVTVSGLRYKWQGTFATPDMFGAIPNDNIDDATALLAWLNSDNYALYAPTGIYDSSVELARFNKGGVLLYGDGNDRSVIRLMGNTNGISIINPLNGNYGAVTIRDIGIQSGGAKTGTKEALIITTQSEQRPGPAITNVAIKSLTLNQEWTTGLRLHDCSGSLVTNLDVQAASLTVCSGVLLTNSPNRPSFEHSFVNPNIRNAYRGISVAGAATGDLGIEGIQIVNPNLVNIRQGIYGKSFQGSPHFSILGGHINAVGGEAIYLEGYQQIVMGSPVVYIRHDDNFSLTASRGVYFKDVIGVYGGATVVLQDNVPYAMELAGSGTLIDFDITNITDAAPAGLLNISSGYPAVEMALSRVWTGNTTWGSGAGGTITDPGNALRRKFSLSKSAYAPSFDFAALRYVSGNWKAVGQAENTAFLMGGGGVSTTIDPSLINYHRTYNGASTITLTIDVSKFTREGQTFYVNRSASSSTGTINITTTNPGSNQIQNEAGDLVATYALPPITQQTVTGFVWNGTHLERMTK